MCLLIPFVGLGNGGLKLIDGFGFASLDLRIDPRPNFPLRFGDRGLSHADGPDFGSSRRGRAICAQVSRPLPVCFFPGGIPNARPTLSRHVPTHLRHILAAESGCNDGAAFPFLFIAIYLVLDDSDAHAVGQWFYITWLCESPVPSPYMGEP